MPARPWAVAQKLRAKEKMATAGSTGGVRPECGVLVIDGNEVRASGQTSDQWPCDGYAISFLDFKEDRTVLLVWVQPSQATTRVSWETALRFSLLPLRGVTGYGPRGQPSSRCT